MGLSSLKNTGNSGVVVKQSGADVFVWTLFEAKRHPLFGIGERREGLTLLGYETSGFGLIDPMSAWYNYVDWLMG